MKRYISYGFSGAGSGSDFYPVNGDRLGTSFLE